MRNKIAELAIAGALMGGGMPRIKIPKHRTGKTLSDYRVPPRSMTEAEKAHYDKHKNLNNFYK